MKKKIGMIIAIMGVIILLTILLLGVITYSIDARKVAKGETPQFCFKVDYVSDGGTIIYTGLGYKVIEYHKANGYDTMKIGSWFLKYEEHLGEKYQEHDLNAKYGKIEVTDRKKIEALLQELMYAENFTIVNCPESIKDGIEITYDRELSKEQLTYNSEAIFTSIPTLKTIRYHVKIEPSILVRREEYDDNVAKISFKGTIIASTGIFEQEHYVKEDKNAGKIHLLIEPDEGESVRNSSDKISITIENDQGESWDPGTKVEVICTDKILETYPTQMDCVSIKTIGANKTVEMYKKIIDELINTDEALNEKAQYIAIDLENFLTFRIDEKDAKGGFARGLSKNEKQEIIEYIQSQYQKEVKVASMKQLEEQGFVDKQTGGIEGIAIYIEQIQELTNDKVVISMAKYRSGLGAIFPTYELTYQQENGWLIKTLKMAIS